MGINFNRMMDGIGKIAQPIIDSAAKAMTTAMDSIKGLLNKNVTKTEKNVEKSETSDQKDIQKDLKGSAQLFALSAGTKPVEKKIITGRDLLSAAITTAKEAKSTPALGKELLERAGFKGFEKTERGGFDPTLKDDLKEFMKERKGFNLTDSQRDALDTLLWNMINPDENAVKPSIDEVKAQLKNINNMK